MAAGGQACMPLCCRANTVARRHDSAQGEGATTAICNARVILPVSPFWLIDGGGWPGLHAPMLSCEHGGTPARFGTRGRGDDRDMQRESNLAGLALLADRWRRVARLACPYAVVRTRWHAGTIRHKGKGRRPRYATRE